MSAKTNTVTGADIIADARRYLGVPYLYGGTNPKVGMDCSGFVQRVCFDLGINSCPRTSEEQASWGIPISEAETGCMIFFVGAEDDPPPGHVGLVVMNGSMINEPHTGLSCQIENYTTNGTGENKFLGYRRIPTTVTSPTGNASTLSTTTQKQRAQTAVQGAESAAVAFGVGIGLFIVGMIIVVGGIFLWKVMG